MESSTAEILPAPATVERVDQEGKQFVELATELAIRSDEGLETATEFRRGLRALRKEINDTFDPIIEKAREALDEARGQKKRRTDVLDRADAIVEEKVVSFTRAKAEAARIEEEARRRREQELLDQEALERAEKAAEFGDDELAKEILENVESSQPTAAEPAAKIEGLRRTWKGRVVSLSRLVDSVSNNRVPITVIQASEAGINAYARATKGTIKVPGLEFYPSDSAPIRGNR